MPSRQSQRNVFEEEVERCSSQREAIEVMCFDSVEILKSIHIRFHLPLLMCSVPYRVCFSCVIDLWSLINKVQIMSFQKTCFRGFRFDVFMS